MHAAAHDHAPSAAAAAAAAVIYTVKCARRYVRDSVTAEQYTEHCKKLIAQFRTLREVGIKFSKIRANILSTFLLVHLHQPTS
jgi:hypothetical protein